MKRFFELFLFNLRQAAKPVLLILLAAILVALYFLIFHWIFVTVQSIFGMVWAIIILIFAVIILSALGATVVEFIFEKLGIK